MVTMNWRRISRILSVIVIVGLVVLVAAAWFIGGKLVASANTAVGPPPPDFPAKSIDIESESGTTLAAWYLAVPGSNATAILLHPNRGNRRSMLSRARLLRQYGYSTLLIDLQAHGESRGNQITAGFTEKYDVLAAVEYVRSNDSKQKIVIIGRSLGGAATLFAHPNVDAIVLESVFPTISEAVHNRVKMRLGFLHQLIAPLLLAQLKPRLGISQNQIRPIDYLNKLKCPILITSGNRDEHTTISETKRIFQAANSPKRLVIFEGAGHVDLLANNPSKYENEIIGFINDNIGVR